MFFFVFNISELLMERPCNYIKRFHVSPAESNSSYLIIHSHDKHCIQLTLPFVICSSLILSMNPCYLIACIACRHFSHNSYGASWSQEQTDLHSWRYKKGKERSSDFLFCHAHLLTLTGHYNMHLNHQDNCLLYWRFA